MAPYSWLNEIEIVKRIEEKKKNICKRAIRDNLKKSKNRESNLVSYLN